MKEGWTFLYNSPRWHYFRNSRSLCGRWLYLGDDDALEQGKENSPDNCKGCVAKRLKEIAKQLSSTGIERTK